VAGYGGQGKSLHAINWRVESDAGERRVVVNPPVRAIHGDELVYEVVCSGAKHRRGLVHQPGHTVAGAALCSLGIVAGAAALLGKSERPAVRWSLLGASVTSVAVGIRLTFSRWTTQSIELFIGSPALPKD
jgi:hypothetical protein